MFFFWTIVLRKNPEKLKCIDTMLTNIKLIKINYIVLLFEYPCILSGSLKFISY